MWWAVCLALSLLWLFYQFWLNKYNYWKKRGFPFIEGKFPYGNMKEVVLFTKYQGHVLQDLYREAAPHPYVGLFSIRRHQLMIRDPEIIKHILVKDFAHFRDRLVLVRKNEVLTDHLFSLTGDKWRAMRVKLTPTFTSGKLKNMYPLFKECSAEFDRVLEDRALAGRPTEIKDLVANFTCDIIASCAFGLETKSHNHVLRKVGQNTLPSPPPMKMKLVLALNHLLPELENIFQLEVFPQSVADFMLNLVSENVEFREKNDVMRHDFLDLLIQIKNKGKLDVPSNEANKESDGEKLLEPIEITMGLLAAQCFIFLVAGFETSSSVQSFCMYELSKNPEIQERLREEIDEVTAKHEGELTYQAIQEMTYLDQVVSETMRKYPTLPFLNRTCSKKYRMPDSGLEVEEGTRVIIPVYALHHDPQYYPDPERFDPDRFSAERKSTIHPYTYLPFGEGPRLCIGMRFGLLQTKLGISTVLRKYKLSTCEETQEIEFGSSNTVTATASPIMLKVELRPTKIK